MNRITEKSPNNQSHKWTRIEFTFRVNLCMSIIHVSKKRGDTTMEPGPKYIYILQSFVFSRENPKLSSVLSVLSCYITCIAHTFHINGI